MLCSGCVFFAFKLDIFHAVLGLDRCFCKSWY